MKHKYRTYKNGITGHRYKRYYITAQGRKNYSVLDPQGMTVRTALPAFEDAEWEIDKVTVFIIFISRHGIYAQRGSVLETDIAVIHIA